MTAARETAAAPETGGSSRKKRTRVVSRHIDFTQTGDFEACRAAEQWCRENGFSVGRPQAGAPRGIMRGDYDIQKWRNLRKEESAALDGLMIGDMRRGPVTISLFEDAEGRQS